MTDNVVFPERFARGPGLGPDDQGEADSASPEARRRMLARVRLREIENAAGARGVGKKGHIFGRVADRIIAARAVGALVRQAKGSNVTVSQIQAVVGGSQRIDRYSLPPDCDAAAAEAKSGKLLQQVAGYLKVAEAVAKLTRQDADALKIQILSGTSLWSNPSAAQTDDDPRATHLAAELIEMGRSVIGRTKLKRVLERARRIPGVWDLADETFLATLPNDIVDTIMRNFSDEYVPGTRSACLPEGFYLGLHQHWTEAPPLPSIPLARHLHATLFPPVLRIESLARDERLTGDAALDSDFIGDECVGWIELWREIRLAIGPMTSADNLGPMFESRAHVALMLTEPSPHRYGLTPSHTLKPRDTLLDLMENTPPAVFQVRLGNSWRRVAMTGHLAGIDGRLYGGAQYPIDWAANPLDPESSVIEHWYPSWSAINSQSVAHWLDRRAEDPETMVVTPPDGDKRDLPVWYMLGSTAHQIERALVTGGLEQALEAAVARVSDQLDRREAEWRAAATAVHETRMMNWQQDL